MENIEEVRKMIDMFERGEIKQEDMDIKMQFAIADLYKSEIEEIREEIYKDRKEIELYNKMTNSLNDVQKLLDNYSKQEYIKWKVYKCRIFLQWKN